MTRNDNVSRVPLYRSINSLEFVFVFQNRIVYLSRIAQVELPQIRQLSDRLEFAFDYLSIV